MIELTAEKRMNPTLGDSPGRPHHGIDEEFVRGWCVVLDQPDSYGFPDRARLPALSRDNPSWVSSCAWLIPPPSRAACPGKPVKRSDLSGHAGYGHCASHSRYFGGFRLYLISTPDSMPVIWGPANPKIGNVKPPRPFLEHDHHLIREGQVILRDKGFAGREFEAVITWNLGGATLSPPDRKDEEPRFGRLGGIRQWIESVFDTLKDKLGLEDHVGRTLEGVHARVGARLFALAAGIWHNWRINAPRKRSLIAHVC